ncbi:MAG: hypothetical protein HDS78_01545 [Bacteroidales bacterium]|nr:hypothetical protein [Bacteroidales bacterium]MBD5219009.1 hypothetical protein [Bacteroidales bacterium]
MKTFNKTLRKMLGAIIALLGFSACGEELCMYGTPSGEYEISGLVYGDDNEKLDGAMVTTSMRDTIYTSEGKYTIKSPERTFPINKIEVKAEKSGYKDQTKEVTLEYSGGKGSWYEGKAEAVQDFNLQKSE